MTTQVALLRGINVGGQKKVPMGDLRELASELGLDNPRTYVQSGNLVVDADLDEAGLVTTLQSGIGDRFGLDVPVIARAASPFVRIAETHPFSGLGLDERMLHVAFLDREPDKPVVDLIDTELYQPDRLEARGREIYLAYPNGSGRSELNHALLERRLGVAATARNWRTVSKLAEMAASPT